MAYVRTAQNHNKSVRCSHASNLFYERGWQVEVFKVMKNDQFLVSLAFGPFPQVLGEVKE